MSKLVCGVGVNDLDESISFNGVHLIFYRIWKHVIQRCYSSKIQERQPTYSACNICDEWKYLSKFKQWFDDNYIEGFDLDKDILVEGNKIYSPDACRFVPRYLNSLLTDHRNARGNFPVGISEQKINSKCGKINSTYRAQCNNGYGKQISKTFKTVEEASAWYSTTKKRIVKEQATRAFLDNSIKTDVYLALVRRDF